MVHFSKNVDFFKGEKCPLISFLCTFVFLMLSENQLLQYNPLIVGVIPWNPTLCIIVVEIVEEYFGLYRVYISQQYRESTAQVSVLS